MFGKKIVIFGLSFLMTVGPALNGLALAPSTFSVDKRSKDAWNRAISRRGGESPDRSANGTPVSISDDSTIPQRDSVILDLLRSLSQSVSTNVRSEILKKIKKLKLSDEDRENLYKIFVEISVNRKNFDEARLWIEVLSKKDLQAELKRIDEMQIGALFSFPGLDFYSVDVWPYFLRTILARLRRDERYVSDYLRGQKNKEDVLFGRTEAGVIIAGLNIIYDGVKDEKFSGSSLQRVEILKLLFACLSALPLKIDADYEKAQRELEKKYKITIEYKNKIEPLQNRIADLNKKLDKEYRLSVTESKEHKEKQLTLSSLLIKLADIEEEKKLGSNTLNSLEEERIKI